MEKLLGLFEGGSKETQKKRLILFYTICITFALLVTMLVVLVGGIIVANIPKPTPEAPSIGETTTTVFDNAQLHSGNLLILNDTNSYNGTPSVISMQDCKTRPKLEDGVTNAYTVSKQSTSICATQETVDAFNKMIKDFYAKFKNDNVIVLDAYNTAKSVQDPLFSAGTVLKLEYFRLDDQGQVAGREALSKEADGYSWIYSNAHKYGFIFDESAQDVFRYVGVDHATAMNSKKLSFGDYLTWLKSNASISSPLLITSGGTTYAIYYLDADGEHFVPVEHTYTVSGNNVDGYVVSVKIPSPTEN